MLLLVYWPQDHHGNFPRGMLLIPGVERGDFQELGPQLPSFVGSSYLCHCAHLPVLHLHGDLWETLHIEKPARMALPPPVGGGHHIG